MTGGRQPYKRGAAFENRCANELRGLGCLVLRNTGSRGDPLAAAFDLIAILPAMEKSVSLIECKLSGRLDPGPKKKLIDTAVKYGCLAVLAFPDNGKANGTIVYRQLHP